MKPVITHPTALKGLLLLTLIANLSYSSSLFLTRSGQANLSSETVNRVPADDSLAPVPAADASDTGGNVGIGTTAAATVAAPAAAPQTLSADALKAKAARAALVANKRGNGKPTQAVAKPTVDALAKSLPAPVPPAPRKDGETAAAPVAAKKDAAHAVRPDSAATCTGDCARPEADAQAKSLKQAQELKKVLDAMTDDQRKQWLACANGIRSKEGCSVAGEKKAVAPTDVAVVNNDELADNLLKAFVEQAKLSGKFSNDADTKARIEKRMGELYDKLHDLVRDMYSTEKLGDRQHADRVIADMTAALQSAGVSTQFNRLAKIESLRAIKPGYQLKDFTDHYEISMESTASQMREAQTSLDLALKQCNQNNQIGQSQLGQGQFNPSNSFGQTAPFAQNGSAPFAQNNVSNCFGVQQKQYELTIRRKMLADIDQQYTSSTQPLISKLLMYRASLSEQEFATYTRGNEEIQQQFQDLLNQNTSGTPSNQATLFGNPGINQGFVNPQFGQASFSGPFGNTASAQTIPYTGVSSNPALGGNYALSSNQFAGFQPRNTGVFGTCQTQQVYNSFVPVQSGCQTTGNYSLTTSAPFANQYSSTNGSYSLSSVQGTPFRQ